MRNIKILKRQFTYLDLDSIDPRIKAAMHGWTVATNHNGVLVPIPDKWDSEIYPYKYFEIYHDINSFDGGPEENEIQCYVECGWRAADTEVLLTFGIFGSNVLDSQYKTVGVCIYKLGGDYMEVFRHGKLITNFEKKVWRFWKRKISVVKTQILTGAGA